MTVIGERADALERMLVQTEQRVLDVLAVLPAWHTMQRRKVQRDVFGTDGFGASHVASALGRLKAKGLVVQLGRDRFRLTDAGRAEVVQ